MTSEIAKWNVDIWILLKNHKPYFLCWNLHFFLILGTHSNESCKIGHKSRNGSKKIYLCILFNLFFKGTKYMQKLYTWYIWIKIYKTVVGCIVSSTVWKVWKTEIYPYFFPDYYTSSLIASQNHESLNVTLLLHTEQNELWRFLSYFT